MSLPRLALVVTVAVATSLFSVAAHAQLTDYTWTGGAGTGTWQSPNWSQVGNADASTYPNSAFHSASISGPLAGPLTLNVDGIDPNLPSVTVGTIVMGGTGAAVSTTIGSVNNGFLLIRNSDDADFNGDLEVSGEDFLLWQKGRVNFGGVQNPEVDNDDGDTNGDEIVDAVDLARWELLYGSTTRGTGIGRIISGGVVGSTNTVTAPIRLYGETLAMDPTSTNDLTLTGVIRPTGGQTGDAQFSASGINNYSGKTLFITGTLNTVDPVSGTVNRRVEINGSELARGTIHFTNSSSIVGAGPNLPAGDTSDGIQIVIGPRFTDEANLPLSTVILSGANSFSGKIELNRANLVLDNDLALGDPNDAVFQTGGPTSELGFNISSTSDSRNIGNSLVLAQPLTIKGENSLTWSGYVAQSNSRRGIINLLPAGETLTLSNRVSTENGEGSSVVTGEVNLSRRDFPLDGRGETIVTGGLHDDDINHNGIIGDGNNDDDLTDDGKTSLGTFIKTGSGVVKVSGTTSTFTGHLQVNMGNIHFDRYDHLATMSASILGDMQARSGAVGIGTTTTFVPQFMALFANSNVNADRGGLMLAPGDATANINYVTNTVNAASVGSMGNTRLMTLAAPFEGMNFTGTITPFGTNSGNRIYRLGGGSGTLSMAGSVLTDPNAGLSVTNGGEVAITSAANFAQSAGNVEITAKYVSTLQEQARLDDQDLAPERFYMGTTLTASVLANGGVASSVGAGTIAANRLLIRGGTLKYVGPNTTTNRLFTIGTGGATIDASGTGTVDFNGAGTLGIELAAARPGDNNSFEAPGSAAVINLGTVNAPGTADLVIGMTVTGFTGGTQESTPSVIDPNTRISDITGDRSIQLSDALPVGSAVTGGTISFGNYTRTLTLAGENGGNNFMRPLIADGTSGNRVGITKEGDGKWILTSNNTYTGPTVVEDGTLLINGNQNANAANLVDPNGTLGGIGTLGGATASLTNNGTVAPGQSVGTLNVGGTFTQGSGGELAIEITAASFDKLAVTGAATLAGTIDVDLQSFTPAVNATFDILTASSVTNSGLSVTGDGIWSVGVIGNTILRLTYLGGAIQSVPEPGALALAAIGMLLVGRRRR